MAAQTRHDAGGPKNASEPPRLHIVHHQASRIRHTDVGEYQVTMYLRGEMRNAQKEIVHVQWCWQVVEAETLLRQAGASP